MCGKRAHKGQFSSVSCFGCCHCLEFPRVEIFNESTELVFIESSVHVQYVPGTSTCTVLYLVSYRKLLKAISFAQVAGRLPVPVPYLPTIMTRVVLQ